MSSVLQVVFCGPYEHHSNLLPWREIKSTVININETADGEVDLEHLKHELQVLRHAFHCQVVSVNSHPEP